LDITFTFDADYLTRMRAKDKDTLNHFYKYFSIPVRNKVAHSVAREDIDDIVQDVFAVVLARIDAGEPREPEKLPGYVFGICRNLILHEYDRKKNPPIPDMDMASFADLRESVEEHLIRGWPKGRCQFILSKLPARYREAIQRVYVMEQDRPTAAREMGTTTDNFRLILCRALQRFKELWQKHFGDFPFGPLPGAT
jgi:RNA polymerase sigma factor (sigma-70 family)